MKLNVRMLGIVAGIAIVGVTTAFGGVALADDGEAPPRPVLESWPGRVVCGGEAHLPDTVCYTEPDIGCRAVEGVIEDCMDRKPGSKPPEPNPAER